MSRKRYEGYLLKYESSDDGKAVMSLYMGRTTRRGTHEQLEIEVEIARSSLYCIQRAIKAFADKEREQVREMPYL